MADLDLLDRYEESLEIARAAVAEPTLPERFCAFVLELQAAPQPTPTLQAKVKDLFSDVNKRVVQYNEQYQILVQEIGLLCRDNEIAGAPPIQKFVANLLDLFQLAVSVYENDTERIAPFAQALMSFENGLKTGAGFLPQEDVAKALLQALTSSAWALTATPQTLSAYAASVPKQGGSKRRTRKQKRTYASSTSTPTNL